MHFILRTSLFSLVLVGGFLAKAQTTYNWIGGTGDYTVAANWSPDRTTPASDDQLVINGTATLTNVPTETIGRLTIGTSAVATLTGTGTLTISTVTSGLVVNTSATLTVDDDVVVILSGGTASISGTLSAKGAVTNAASAITVSGTYDYAYTGGGTRTIPAVTTWAAASTFKVTGNPATISGGMNQAFYNVNWNTTVQTADFGLDAVTSIANELRVNNSGSASVVVSATGVPSSRTNFAKLIAAGAGRLTISTAAAPFAITATSASLGNGSTLTIAGGTGDATLTLNTKLTSTVAAGVLQMSSSTGNGSLVIKGSGTNSIAAAITSTSAASGIVFDGTAQQTVTLSSVAISNLVTLENSNTVGVTFTAFPAGCPLRLASDAGYTRFSGTVGSIGAVTNNDTDGIAATLDFTGTSAQAPVLSTVSAPLTLAVSNAAGVSFSNFPAGCNLDVDAGYTAKIQNSATIAAISSSASSTNAAYVEFNGTAAQTLAITSLDTYVGLRVNNSNGVDFGGFTFPANTYLHATNGAISNVGGYATTTQLIYDGTTPYTTGAEIISGVIRRVYLRNSAGVTFALAANLGLNYLEMTQGNNSSTLFNITAVSANLTGGVLDMGTRIFRVNTAVTYSNGAYVKGKVRRPVSADGTFEFPTGGTDAKSVIVTFNGVTTGGTLDCTYNPANPGTTGLPLSDGGAIEIISVADGFWTVTNNSIVFGTYDITIDATGTPGLADASSARLIKRANGSSPWTEVGSEPTGFTDFTMTGLTTFSDFGIGATSTAFPVELAVFEATAASEANILDWSTASEQNSAYFEVERSANGDNGWVAIGRVAAAGNSESLRSYTFSDHAPLQESHYRLHMVDVDGSSALSEIRSVARTSLSDKVTVGPVPVGDVMTVSVSSMKNDAAMLRVFSVDGTVLLSTPIELGTQQATAIDMSKLAAGVYRVVISGAISYEKTIIKL